MGDISQGLDPSITLILTDSCRERVRERERERERGREREGRREREGGREGRRGVKIIIST